QRKFNDDVPVGAFCWTELVSKDAKASREFYTKIIGWKTLDHKAPDGTPVYTMFTVDEQPSAGLVQPPHELPVSFWLPYVFVSDFAQSAKKAAELGAKIMVEPKVVPGFGTMSIVTDPTGASVALWKPEKK